MPITKDNTVVVCTICANIGEHQELIFTVIDELPNNKTVIFVHPCPVCEERLIRAGKCRRWTDSKTTNAAESAL